MASDGFSGKTNLVHAKGLFTFSHRPALAQASMEMPYDTTFGWRPYSFMRLSSPQASCPGIRREAAREGDIWTDEEKERVFGKRRGSG